MTALSDAQTTRLLDLLDRQDITTVLVRFARYLDEKDFTAYAALYAEDGVLDTSRDVHEGRAGLAEHVERDLGGFVATHHVSASHDIVVDGDTATARSSLHATHVRSADMGDFWVAGGYYDTTLRRGGALGWEITSTVIHPTWLLDTRQAPTLGLGAQ